MSAGFQPPGSQRVVEIDRPILIDVDPSDRPSPPRSWLQTSSAVSVSFVLHAVVLIALSMIYFGVPDRILPDFVLSLVIGKDEPLGDNFEFELAEGDPASPEEPATASDEPDVSIDELVVTSVPQFDSPTNPPVDDPQQPAGEKLAQSKPKPKASASTAAAAKKKSANGKSTTGKGDNVAVEAPHADHFVGRSAAGKAALLKRMGGTDESEAAVARGLVWLKNHQLPNGSWNFDHTVVGQCDCTMPGRLFNNPNGATAMALLAFLGAGQTHQEGQYQREVERGLKFLVSNGTPVGKGICFYGALAGPPTFYTHGLVTIALGEAYAMTHDDDLRPAVAGAVEFLSATQDSGGGWRYFPGQPGDTSVVAWELMALKSAQFSRITIAPKVFKGVDRFLGSVASARGSQYAYTPERKLTPKPSMTAAGLLCRMYLDWDETTGGLRSGVHFLDEHGPDPNDMYFNYYATQVLHHWGGDEWNRWNKVMREHLIVTQIRLGHATGSWDVADLHGNMGGRLYMTSLALLTLEVYYRHLPLYQKDRIEIPLLTPETK
jgi:hypothetical protein